MKSPPLLSPDELREWRRRRECVDLPRPRLALLIHFSTYQIRRWEAGISRIPDDACKPYIRAIQDAEMAREELRQSIHREIRPSTAA